MVLPVSDRLTWHQSNSPSWWIMWCSGNRQNKTMTTKKQNASLNVPQVVRTWHMSGESHRTWLENPKATTGWSKREKLTCLNWVLSACGHQTLSELAHLSISLEVVHSKVNSKMSKPQFRAFKEKQRHLGVTLEIATLTCFPPSSKFASKLCWSCATKPEYSVPLLLRWFFGDTSIYPKYQIGQLDCSHTGLPMMAADWICLNLNPVIKGYVLQESCASEHFDEWIYGKYINLCKMSKNNEPGQILMDLSLCLFHDTIRIKLELMRQ